MTVAAPQDYDPSAASPRVRDFLKRMSEPPSKYFRYEHAILLTR